MSFLNPDSILQSIGIFQEGMKVADFGCGAGYFSVPLSRLVGGEGRVYAVDVLVSALDTVKRKMNQQGLVNIELIRANLERIGSASIPQASLQAVLLVTILFQSDKKQDILQESKRVLQPGGFLIIIDWEVSAPIGPGEKAWSVSKEEMIALAREAGFTFQREFPVDAYHYGLLFKV